MGDPMETLHSVLAEAGKVIERLDELEHGLKQREVGRTLRAYLRVAKTHFREAQRLLLEAEDDCEEVTKVWVRK